MGQEKEKETTKCYMEELDRSEDWNYALYLGPVNSTNASVLVNSAKLAEFIQEKIRTEYAGFKTKAEIHSEHYRKTHPRSNR